ncbi:MAG TPA: hypothetical protein VNU64_24535 [Burkholderiales bacterium]|nr:hypothetical protein [Burkholderiales bacterium]
MTRLLVAVLLGLAPALAAAQELGRLFFTPQQRSALDERRRARVPDKPTAAVVAAPVTRVDGYVKRSGGPSTVWINGDPLSESAPEAPRIDTSRTPSGSVSITVGESGARMRLKPGEALDRGTGEVRDVIGDGDIRVQPSR